MIKEAWVLRLKDKTKAENGLNGEWYFSDDLEEYDWLTTNLDKAILYSDKDQAIKEFKKHEQAMIDQFGSHAICNFGYTNIMSNFEFVEVEVEAIE